jgi:hypothetical protein
VQLQQCLEAFSSNFLCTFLRRSLLRRGNESCLHLHQNRVNRAIKRAAPFEALKLWRLCVRVLASMMLLGSLFSTVTFAQQRPTVETKDERVFMIRAYYQSDAQLQAIASQFQHVIMDQKTASVKTEAYAADISALTAAGINVVVDQTETTALRAGEDAAQYRWLRLLSYGGRNLQLHGYDGNKFPEFSASGGHWP